MRLYGYRYYDPLTGRWPSRDPIGIDGGINLYEAHCNNPLKWYDYSGFYPRPVDGGFAFTGQRDEKKRSLDHSWADAAGGPKETDNPNLGQGTNGKDILDHLAKLSKENCCVRRYTIAGHGRHAPLSQAGQVPGKSSIPSTDFPVENGLYARGDEYWGVPKGPNARTTDDLKKAIADGKIAFCPRCLIQIHACNMAGLIQPLSEATHCQVIAAGGFCDFSPNKRAPRDWVSSDYDPTNGFRGAGDQFWQSANGSEPKPIGHTFSPTLTGPIK